MSFKDNVGYSRERMFTIAELLPITPDGLSRWINQQAYGDPVPTEDMRPVHRRSSTLEFSTKAISSFMPGVNATWDPVTAHGNPTAQMPSKRLIKKVKKFEVRREGAKNKARRSVEFDEFMNLLQLVRAQWADNDSAYIVRWCTITPMAHL
ncbi:hypothetical protein PR003_g5153 [Phytophthora rubi]|uniref:Uncharacterized protein n=1 Tax=Phytophthora rubi TaxID=129364 RepID=A0A6A4FTL7_9STRA|nr:hypothetical protein PR003_g5153 [Phytophthora rubi]